jgi:hypothetical protein
VPLLCLVFAGCSGDGSEGDEGAADTSSTASDLGRDRSRDFSTEADSSGLDAASDSEDRGADLLCLTDADGDGHVARACGGDDCDDGEPRRHGELPESCDFLDNDCDGVLNDEIECGFFAHTGSTLYLIDPFFAQAEPVAILPEPELWDIDTHPDGTLYGVNAEALYRFDESASIWVVVGEPEPFVGDANGLAIDLEGTAYVTSGNFLYSVDLGSGEGQLVGQIGPLGTPFESSGDCVVNKDDTLFMSSRHRAESDSLIVVNGLTGEGTEIGVMGFQGVYGLTAAWGHLFGLTEGGQLIEINESTGEAELLHEFPGMRWFGAASTPDR